MHMQKKAYSRLLTLHRKEEETSTDSMAAAVTAVRVVSSLTDYGEERF